MIKTIFCIIVCTLFVQLLTAQQVKKPVIVYVNSYHQGYGSSDSIMAGINLVLKKQATLYTYFLNAKKQPVQLTAVADSCILSILALKPQLLIASDDDAVRELVLPLLKLQSIPVVYCGVNWTAKSYALPRKWVTGMLEVLPVESMLLKIKKAYPSAVSIAILSEDSPAEQKNSRYLDTLYKRLGLQPFYFLVNNFTAWKGAFIKAQEQTDVLFLSTNGAIEGWKHEEAKIFVKENITKPVVTCDDFMMSYAVYGETKVAKEQGIWAGQTALKIIKGLQPVKIPIARNQQSQLWVNTLLAEKIKLPTSILSLTNIKKYIQ